MNNCPYRVTICSPIYGVEKYIERCAVSLFEQTYSDIEYIFVNDCTKDRSIEILKELIERYPDRKKDVRIIEHERNRGLSAARNTGVDNVKTDYLIWVDSDDYVERNMVESLVSKQIETGADMVCGGVTSIFKEDMKKEFRDCLMSKSDYLHKLLSYETEHWIWGKLYKTSLYRDNNIRNIEGTNMAEDYQTFPLLLNSAQTIAFVEDTLYNYNRINDNSLTSGYSEKKQRESFESLLYIADFFKGTEYEKDVQKYLLILFFDHMKPFIKGAHITDEHKNFFRMGIKEIPTKVYFSLSLRDFVGVIYSRLFII